MMKTPTTSSARLGTLTTKLTLRWKALYKKPGHLQRKKKEFSGCNLEINLWRIEEIVAEPHPPPHATPKARLSLTIPTMPIQINAVLKLHNHLHLL
jgi:hypothetical protein